MPANLAAERGVIAGAALHGVECFFDVADLISVNSFTLDTNQLLWRCLEHLYQNDCKVADLPSIFSSAQALGILDILQKPDERAHVRAILNFNIERENVRKLAIKVRKLQVARENQDRLREAEAALDEITGDESISHILGIAENKVLQASMGAVGPEEPINIGDHSDSYIDNVINNPVDMVGVSTGFPIWDLSIGGGLQAGVNMIGARQKIGKSTLAQNMAYNIAKQGLKTFFGDTEMDEEDKYPRFYAMVSGVEINEVKTGKFAVDKGKLHRINKAREVIKNLPIKWANLIGLPFEDILPVIRRWLIKEVGIDANGIKQPAVLVLDYFKLCGGNEMQQLTEWQQLGFNSAALHDFCKKYKLPCLAFTQLNKEMHIAASDRILNSVSSYSIFEEKAQSEIDEYPTFFGNRKLTPKLLRHGGGLSDGDYINIFMNGKIARVKEGLTRYTVHNNQQSAGFDLNDNQPFYEF